MALIKNIPSTSSSLYRTVEFTIPNHYGNYSTTVDLTPYISDIQSIDNLDVYIKSFNSISISSTGATYGVSNLSVSSYSNGIATISYSGNMASTNCTVTGIIVIHN